MKRLKKDLISLFVLLLSVVYFSPVTAFATEDYEALAEERKKMTIESNLIDNWPVGPEIGAESAMLIEANSGIVLYEKNSHEHLYPASITKILTALVAFDNCDMDEEVTFSYEAVNSIDWRLDANMGINGGSTITMEETLYGMLVGSANEAAYAIAEHISGNGNLEAFAKLMNEKAASLGCTDSNFVTPNGIHDDNHYTSAHDMALIARAFFTNDYLANISRTPTYTFAQTATQPKSDMAVYAKSKLFPGKEYACEGLVGTKTGYTSLARQTLVSSAERNGIQLVCVIMKEESPYQYIDTLDLFNYGFSNFTTESIADKDSRFNISSSNLFNTDIDIFGSSKPILEINPNSYIVLPNGSTIDKTECKIEYDNLKDSEIARIDYYYSDTYVGSAQVIPSQESYIRFDFDEITEEFIDDEDKDSKFIFINVYVIIGIIIGIALILGVVFLIISLIRHKKKAGKLTRNNNREYKYQNDELKW